ncbi:MULTISPECIES: patatin-like phospholipase family protein [Mammaliicoccus]|jgi:predicted patatin/cPLA2 family phospholipase|uniref:Patatin family protein n=1 Tax=Mammaliicoccus lentus TaxID=42858 RepID=A0ABS6GZU6_MAMLE|nr:MULTISPECIES: patatin family protein [Mammaliicoccus]HBV04440.1 patatin family protein [Staphylococcus sp.]MBF0795794.1 patatin family protein [Mammaliicoccus lentus]MBU6114985.1 patatin family protein [Mammaliicoccus lentus]MBW0763523.1 patatin family protein [Mammaliicoccus lentus]MBW0768823.1 patatin family protein [Mammaliicoccus lentus]
MIKDTGLILEGGGMRSMYTAGVLDFFIKEDIYFEYNIGVSAGASMAASYISRQFRRNHRVTAKYIKDKRYLSLSNYIKRKELFGMDFVYHYIPTYLEPFDFEKFDQAEEKFVVVTTDCETGEAVYFDKNDTKGSLLTALEATSSLPLMANPVQYKGHTLLDGGIVDPIPIKKSIEEGYTKNVLILTRPKGYRKTPSRFSKVFRMKAYPKVNHLMELRYKHYNKTLDWIEEEEDKGNIFVIRPTNTLAVDRVEKDPRKLDALYREGYADAEKIYKDLKEYVEK